MNLAPTPYSAAQLLLLQDAGIPPTSPIPATMTGLKNVSLSIGNTIVGAIYVPLDINGKPIPTDDATDVVAYGSDGFLKPAKSLFPVAPVYVGPEDCSAYGFPINSHVQAPPAPAPTLAIVPASPAVPTGPAAPATPVVATAITPTPSVQLAAVQAAVVVAPAATPTPVSAAIAAAPAVHAQVTVDNTSRISKLEASVKSLAVSIEAKVAPVAKAAETDIWAMLRKVPGHIWIIIGGGAAGLVLLVVIARALKVL